VDNWNNITNSQNRVRKKSFGGTFCFSNCHIIRLDTGGLVFLVSEPAVVLPAVVVPAIVVPAIVLPAVVLPAVVLPAVVRCP
jgi:hypothetical protein